MSDEQNNDYNEQPDTEPKRSQKLPSADEIYDDSTITFDDVYTSRRRKKDFDPTKDTAILPEGNRIIRRILNKREENENTMSLEAKQEVILLIRGMVERLILEEGIIYKLGRFEIGASAADEIDLTPYGAQDRGVSRIHAQLHYENGKVFITDLGSTNGTFISSERLEPEKSVALRKGDELLLGRLSMQVLFR